MHKFIINVNGWDIYHVNADEHGNSYRASFDGVHVQFKTLEQAIQYAQNEKKPFWA
jgi:hypothetical protein